MCGISAAIIRDKNHKYWDLLKVSEIRGQDGTGYVIHDTKHQSVFNHKSPFKASLLSSFPILNPGDIVVGQNRLAIFGLDHGNDQPLVTERFTLVHNGNLFQFEEVFEREHLPRRLQVDTELILRRLEKTLVGEHTVFWYKRGIANALVGLKGNWACLVYDRVCGLLSVFAYQKPLHVCEHGGNTYFFSTERIGRKVFGPDVRIHPIERIEIYETLA